MKVGESQGIGMVKFLHKLTDSQKKIIQGKLNIFFKKKCCRTSLVMETKNGNSEEFTNFSEKHKSFSRLVLVLVYRNLSAKATRTEILPRIL